MRSAKDKFPTGLSDYLNCGDFTFSPIKRNFVLTHSRKKVHGIHRKKPNHRNLPNSKRIMKNPTSSMTSVLFGGSVYKDLLPG